MVGGAVRDLLMGHIPKDADMAFGGSAQDFMCAFPQAQQVGKSVHVWLLNGREYVPLHNNCLEDDLRHRDLTINAMALDQNGILYTHPMAFFDLKNGILRPASEQAFHHDPTRIYRLARFASTFQDFTVHASALQQGLAVIQEGKHVHIPAERVGREMFKALQAPCPSRFMYTLEKMQGLNPWFAELADLSRGQRYLWGQCMDSYTMGENAETYRLGGNYHLAMLRWMFLGAFYGEGTQEQNISSFQDHALYHLGQRLSLPLAFSKAAFCMAETFVAACQLRQLSLEEQVCLVHKVHKLGLSELYWAALDHLCEQLPHHQSCAHSTYALALLRVLHTVHLPEEWHNKGAKSGKKLLQMQVQAWEIFLQNNAL